MWGEKHERKTSVVNISITVLLVQSNCFRECDGNKIASCLQCVFGSYGAISKVGETDVLLVSTVSLVRLAKLFPTKVTYQEVTTWAVIQFICSAAPVLDTHTHTHTYSRSSK